MTEDNPTPDAALDAYVEEVTARVAAAKEGRPVDDLIPVNISPIRFLTTNSDTALRRPVNRVAQAQAPDPSRALEKACVHPRV